ncbi:hypothetical protein [Helicobacter himalayensis]|nr:hypothetical protein [Helicobacter himalayensis]
MSVGNRIVLLRNHIATTRLMQLKKVRFAMIASDMRYDFEGQHV